MTKRTTMFHVRVNSELKRRATDALETMGLTAADAVRLLFRRIVVDQAFPLELKVPNAASRRAVAEVEAMVQEDATRYPPNRPPPPGDVSWAAYWRAIQECDAWWKRGPADFSVFPPGKSWVGVIRKLRPSLHRDWADFDETHHKRVLGCASRHDEDWALLGNMFGFAIKPVFGDPTIRREVETIVKGVIDSSDDAFLETVNSAYASLIALPRLGPAVATRLLTLARPDRCVSWNGASSAGLAAYSAQVPQAHPGLNPYGRLLQGIYKHPWFSENPGRFGSPDEEEAWSMRVALLDAFIYTPSTH